MHGVSLLSPSIPRFVVGDFNAHIRPDSSLYESQCPCHHLPRTRLASGTAALGRARGDLLVSACSSLDLAMVNGCSHLPCHTYTELREPGPQYTSCLDYILADRLAMALSPSFSMLDLRSASARTGHSHLIVSFPVSTVASG